MVGLIVSLAAILQTNAKKMEYGEFASNAAVGAEVSQTSIAAVQTRVA